MSGKLYLVGTPIGNLGDISARALETLRNADFIAAEDTRVTRGLMTHFDIRRPLVSYYEHNAAHSGETIVARLLAGESCALVTDAGMPAVSDPGSSLVELCAEAGVPVEAVPGPSALTCSLALSVLPVGRFCFEGFLSTARKSRREHLEELRSERRTMVFFEAPHKLQNTLGDLLLTLGNRRITVCRELTKLYEQVLHTTLKDALDYFADTPPRGEFVLLVEGAPKAEGGGLEEAVDRAREYVAMGDSVRDAARKAQTAGVSRRDIYEALLRMQE